LETSKKSLKIDLHIHTSDDPEEPVRHTTCELLDKAHYLGYDAVSITNHNGICYTDYYRDYARERGIILIPGVEIGVEGKHVLVLNATEDALSASTFADLGKIRNPSNLIVAPHPFFPGFSSLLWQVEKNIDIFDALEFSWFYHSRINFNTFALRMAERYELPLICTSDCHHLEKFGSAYSLVESEKDTEAIIEAIRCGRIQIMARPLNFVEFVRHGVEHVVDVTQGTMRRLWNGKR
jgi:hypothetical protein